MKYLCAALATLALGGCASPSLYQWGGYDDLLYQSYKSADRTESMRVGLETHLSALEKAKQPIPPGLYAEIGTNYLEKGDRTTAVVYYKKERQTWPESKGLMDAMINTLDKQPAGAPQ